MASDSDDVVHYSIHVEADAVADIEALYAFVQENADTLAAERQIKKVFECIRKLDIFPNGHPICELSPEMRVAHVGKYCVIFNVDDAAHKVSIARIFHARQDINTQDL